MQSPSISFIGQFAQNKEGDLCWRTRKLDWKTVAMFSHGLRTTGLERTSLNVERLLRRKRLFLQSISGIARLAFKQVIKIAADLSKSTYVTQMS